MCCSTKRSSAPKDPPHQKISRTKRSSAPRAGRPADGINALMYYSTKIFRIAGRSDPTVASLAIGVTNAGASLLSVWIVNSFGAPDLS